MKREVTIVLSVARILAHSLSDTTTFVNLSGTGLLYD